MVKIRLDFEFTFQGFLQQFTHFAELRKDNRLFALLLNGLEQVQQHAEFPGIFDLGLARLQERSRVVANLLERQNHLENQALAFKEAVRTRALTGSHSHVTGSRREHIIVDVERGSLFEQLQLFHELVESPLVKSRLRTREFRIFVLLNLVGQITDNRLVRLHAA